MNATIRSVDDLVAGLRGAQLERELSNEALEHVSGLAKGHVDKILGPGKVKGLGQLSLPLMLWGLGKALLLVDDPKALQEAKEHWDKRKLIGGAVAQAKRNKACASQLASAAGIEDELRERMRELAKLTPREAKVKGGKRRMQALSKRARQRMAAHAARMRWAKRVSSDS